MAVVRVRRIGVVLIRDMGAVCPSAAMPSVDGAFAPKRDGAVCGVRRVRWWCAAPGEGQRVGGCGLGGALLAAADHADADQAGGEQRHRRGLRHVGRVLDVVRRMSICAARAVVVPLMAVS